MKLLIIVNHCSTGGMPQYVVKLVETLKNKYDIYVIEYHDVSPDYVVQKNVLKKLLGNKMITLYGTDDEKAIKFFENIERINPDIIHLQEIPEMSLSNDVATKLYQKDRKYKIVETSHDSGYNIEDKRFFPDSFAFISQFHPNQYKEILEKYKIPYEIVEYPIEIKERPDRNTALRALGLDPKYKHILNVGLFTPRKNQAEIFEMARLMTNYRYKFHFVGNQADNFKYYWEPLMKNVPSNCVIWGERSDVDKFYQSMDLFLFTSRGQDNDRETNPIVLKEAMSWQMPVMMYNLPVYCGMYDNKRHVYFMEYNQIKRNMELIERVMMPSTSGNQGSEDTSFPEIKFTTNVVHNDIQSTKKKLFEVKFDPTQYRLDFEYKGNEDHKILISIKDIDSHACIYSYNFDAHPGYTCWTIPVPINIYELYGMENFGGFRIDYFENDVLLDFDEVRIREIPVTKPVIDITNTEPIFMNYSEFFVTKIYDALDLSNCNTVLDIGANIGLWTKFIQSKGARKVYAFEPNIVALKELHRNFDSDKSVNIVDKAVSDINGKLELFVDMENSTISSLYGDATKNYTRNGSYLVNTVTLESFFFENNIDEVDLVKIDIEGGEFDIIDNLTEYAVSVIKSFLIELHGFYFTDGDEKIEKLIEKLQNEGYMIYRSPTYLYIYAKRINK